jgi:hypothetical protein
MFMCLHMCMHMYPACKKKKKNQRVSRALKEKREDARLLYMHGRGQPTYMPASCLPPSARPTHTTTLARQRRAAR